MKFNKIKNLLRIRKAKIIFLLLFFIFVGIFLADIGSAKANLLGDIARDLLQGLFYVLLNIAQAFTGFIGNVFTGILNFGFRNLGPIRIGWQISRDIVNMFFILGLVFIAFATILRIEQYGIRKLLPRFIIIAILINFSFVIGAVIIDITQIITNYFASLVQEDVGGAIVETVGVTEALREQPVQTVGIGAENPENIAILTMAFTTAVVFVTGFVLLIGAILLIVRIGALWALLILAPFAWFFSIFPGLKTHANKWWSEFMKWAFFAPVYIFFIYLIIRIGEVWTDEMNMTITTPDALGQLTYSSMFNSMDMVFKFVFLVILLFGAPTIAMSMGIKSAGIVTSRARNVLRGAGKFVGRQAMRPVRRTGAEVGAGLLKAGASLPIIKQTKYGDRLKAKAYQLKQAPLTQKRYKDLEKLYDTFGKKELLKAAGKSGIEGLTAGRAVLKKGLVREADRNTKRTIANNLKAYGDTDTAMALEEIDPGIAGSKATRIEAIKRGKEKGTINNYRENVFEGPMGAEIIEEMRDILTPTEFNEVFTKWAKATKEAAGKALMTGFTDDPIDIDNIERRKAYAKITGKAQEAFWADNTGKIQPTYLSKFENAAKEYTLGMKAKDFGKLKTNKDIVFIANYIDPKQVYGAGTELSGKQKDIMMTVARTRNPQAHARMQTADTWV